MLLLGHLSPEETNREARASHKKEKILEQMTFHPPAEASTCYLRRQVLHDGQSLPHYTNLHLLPVIRPTFGPPRIPQSTAKHVQALENCWNPSKLRILQCCPVKAIVRYHLSSKTNLLSPEVTSRRRSIQ